MCHVSDRQYFQDRLRAPLSSFGLSDVLVGRQTRRSVFNVTKRRETADGVFNGIVSVALSPAEFIDYYKSLAAKVSDLSTFALVKADGAVLARWPEEAEIGYLAVGSPLMTLLEAGQASGTALIDADGGRGTQTVTYRRLGDVPLYMVSGVNRTAVLARWASFIGVLAAIVLPITAVLVYVTWLAMKKTREEEAVAGLLQDQIRARADAERRVLEAQKLETLSLLTGSVAHDFNNLLSVISSSLHVHRKRRPEVAEDKALDAMAKAVQTGVRLTRQLLSFSKKQALRPEVVQLQSWLPQVDSLLRTTLGAMASWNCIVDPDTKPVNVDVGELELALINLILNAKLAMPRGGALSLHVSNERDASIEAPMVVVRVSDNGEGILSSTLPKVFDPFFTTRPKGAGSGLGLSQVQSFCVNAGGRVSMESVVGEGTTVCLHLPAYGGLRVESAVAPTTTNDTLNARLLLVEDNDEVAQTTMQMLESSGLTVVRAESADTALAYLAKEGSVVDLVLSDIAMPGALNGIGLALTLRRLYPKLPVLLHTGYADQLGEATAKGLRVLQKPVPPAVLLPELKAIMERA
jgi:two-component system NtrC family sensor kinase